MRAALPGLSLNVAATLILHTVMAETLGVPVANLPLEVGCDCAYLPLLRQLST